MRRRTRVEAVTPQPAPPAAPPDSFTPKCPYCDAFTVAHFHRGDLIRVYVQHRYASNRCLGRRDELNIAEWLPPTVRVATECMQDASRPRHGSKREPDRRGHERRTDNVVNPRAHRTPDGKMRRR